MVDFPRSDHIRMYVCNYCLYIFINLFCLALNSLNSSSAQSWWITSFMVNLYISQCYIQTALINHRCTDIH